MKMPMGLYENQTFLNLKLGDKCASVPLLYVVFVQVCYTYM